MEGTPIREHQEVRIRRIDLPVGGLPDEDYEDLDDLEPGS